MEFWDHETISHIIRSESAAFLTLFKILVDKNKIDPDIVIECIIQEKFNINFNKFLKYLTIVEKGDFSYDDNALLFHKAKIGDMDGYYIVLDHPSIYESKGIVKDFIKSLEILIGNLSKSSSITYLNDYGRVMAKQNLENTFYRNLRMYR